MQQNISLKEEVVLSYFDQEILEKKIIEIKKLATSLNESLDSNIKSKYPKEIFQPLEEFLNESFFKGLVAKGEKFAKSFTKGARQIAQKISSSVKEFSFKKVFTTVTKMMHKIKAKALKSLMILFEPLREVIIKNRFCDEKNNFQAKETLRKLVDAAKKSGEDIGAPELLTPQVVSAIGNNLQVDDVKGITESEEEEARKGRATFDEKDVKYLQFFQRMMFSLGIKNAKLNGFFSEIAKKVTMGAAITGVAAVIAALFPSMAIASSIAAAAGAAVAAAPVLVMIIGAILFGMGLFMFATWLLKPYPTIENCRIFLSTIFRGAHPFDFPEASLGDIADDAVPPNKAKSSKQPWNLELIADLSEEGVEEDIPKTDNTSSVIEDYDNLDIDLLEDEEEVKNNRAIALRFVRDISSKDGRERILKDLEEIEEIDEENKYTKEIEKFLKIIDEIFAGSAIEEKKEDGKRKFPFALRYRKTQLFLRNKKNSVADRMSKVIDVVDNFIDRVDKATKKDQE